MMGRFRRLLNDVELQEIPLLGRKYTWSNEREAPTLVRLYRVFCTANCDPLFSDCLFQSAASLISDHCPLILGLRDSTRGKRWFHFKSYWTKLDGFLEVVHVVWVKPVEESCPFECLAVKFRALCKALQSWGQRSTGHIKSQIIWAKEILHQLEIAQDNRPLSFDEAWL